MVNLERTLFFCKISLQYFKKDCLHVHSVFVMTQLKIIRIAETLCPFHK